MQATTSGANRTGSAMFPDGAQAMADAAARRSLQTGVDGADGVARAAIRALYVAQADALGTVPPPATLKGAVMTGIGKLMGYRPELLLDKIGERIAFERTGTRLYDALIGKYEVMLREGAHLPSAADAMKANGEEPAALADVAGEDPMETLRRIRAEELAHLHLLCDAARKLGGDPTAQTPCADVVAMASAGLVQVVSDPRTTLAQGLNAMLTAELTDNAGWELLVQLAVKSGEIALSERFLDALEEEAGHLLVVRNWLTVLLTARDSSALV